jgi:predicted acetyltransferase
MMSLSDLSINKNKIVHNLQHNEEYNLLKPSGYMMYQQFNI